MSLMHFRTWSQILTPKPNPNPVRKCISTENNIWRLNISVVYTFIDIQNYRNLPKIDWQAACSCSCRLQRNATLIFCVFLWGCKCNCKVLNRTIRSSYINHWDISSLTKGFTLTAYKRLLAFRIRTFLVGRHDQRFIVTCFVCCESICWVLSVECWVNDVTSALPHPLLNWTLFNGCH